jgi:hypothetical protein
MDRVWLCHISHSPLVDFGSWIVGAGRVAGPPQGTPRPGNTSPKQKKKKKTKPKNKHKKKKKKKK